MGVRPGPTNAVAWLETPLSRGDQTMTVLEQKPLTLSVPLREDPPGVLRVGKSRVLLELVIHEHQQGESPAAIVEMYDTLEVADTFAFIAYYSAHQAEVDEYLRRCDEKAEGLRRTIEGSQRRGPTKEDLLARAKAKWLSL
jgi:uncharacterized protein (DUF433 family)